MRVMWTLACAFVLAGCNMAPLSTRDSQRWQNLKDQHAELIEVKSPGTAMVLQIIPGIGDVYLGFPMAGLGNLVLWPVSYVWCFGTAQAAANNMNKIATVNYYSHGPGAGRYDVDWNPRSGPLAEPAIVPGPEGVNP